MPPCFYPTLAGQPHSHGAPHRAGRIAGSECANKINRPGDYGLNFCDGKEDEGTYPSGVGKLREEVRAAQGIILGTPEYHGGFSGVLKNALDL
jgi:NAD(P)H-dependent FMN reductase